MSVAKMEAWHDAKNACGLRQAGSPMKIRALIFVFVVALVAIPCAAQGTASPLSPEDVAKQIVLEISAGQFARVEARYTPELGARLSAGTLAKAWASALELEGSFDSVV